MLSSVKEVEPGMRAMVLIADGLFRLDVAVIGDSLRTVLRNLSPGAVTRAPPCGGGVEDGSGVSGDAAALEPAIARMAFTLGEGSDAVDVSVSVALLSFRERGTVRLTSRAAVRYAAEPTIAACPAASSSSAVPDRSVSRPWR
ncbi:MAG TPA: hypothetical protein VFN55_00765 [Solirubrobacteraceae bacterium]|nr:hypothetical protein [Solirubrobacteraceae bacterium]